MSFVFSPAVILRWLTEGYPDGVPARDRIPLVALLQRKLTPDQVHEVVDSLVVLEQDSDDSSGINRDEISASVSSVTGAAPSEEDIKRVTAKLVSGGWPIDHADFD